MNENLVADKCEISNGCRLNVPAYIKDESGHYVKDSNGNYIKEEISKELFELLPEGFNHSTSYNQESDTRNVTSHGDSIRNNYNKYIYDTRRI